MAVPLPRRPLRYAAWGLLGWASLTVLGSLPDGDEVWERVVRAGCQALATVFFAVAIGGGFLEFWQRREWKRRTQWIPFDLLNRAIRQLATLVATTADVASATLGRTGTTFISDAFALPWTPVSDQVIEHLDDSSAATLGALLGEQPSDPSEPRSLGSSSPLAAIHGRLLSSTRELKDQVDGLWSIVNQLGEYIDDESAPALLTEVTRVHNAVRELTDPFPGLPPDATTAASPSGVWGLLAAISAKDVIKESAAVARRLSEVYGELRRQVTDDELERKLSNEEEARNASDKATAEGLSRNVSLSRACGKPTKCFAISTVRAPNYSPRLEISLARLVKKVMSIA